MKNIEDTLIEGLQSSLKKCFDEYQTKNTVASDMKSYHEEIKYLGEDADIIPKLIAALNFGDSEEIVKIFFSWYKSNKGWANTLPSMVFFKDTEIEHFVNALKKAEKSYEYWMLLVSMSDCGEISISKENMEYLLMQAIRTDHLRSYAYAYLFYEELSLNYTKELEEIVDNLFKNHRSLLKKLFFEVLDVGMLFIYEGYNPYFALAKSYRDHNDQDGFIRNYRKGVKVNPPEIFTPDYLLFEYETRNGNYEKAALAFKNTKIEETTIDDRELTLLKDDPCHILDKVWENVHLLGYKKLLEAIFPLDKYPRFYDCSFYCDLWLTNKEIASLHDFNDDPMAGFEFELASTKMDNILLEARLKLILTETILDFVKDENQKQQLKEIFHYLRKHERLLANEKHKSIVALAKLAERDRLFSNISHSIKNIIGSSIIAQLNRLKDGDETDSELVVEKALKGADMIRRIINAMNSSVTGSFEDFLYDAAHVEKSSNAEVQPLSAILFNAIYYSIGNLFEGRGAGNLRQKYFANSEAAKLAKDAYNCIEVGNLNELEKFCKEHLVDFKLDIKGLEDTLIGDAKGSATKIFILFQEIILNAVKYCNKNDASDKFIHISLIRENGVLAFKVVNSRNKNIVARGTALGGLIIEKMSKLMNAKVKTDRLPASYSVELDIPDLWEKNKADTIDVPQLEYHKNNDNDDALAIVAEKKGDYDK
jgi:signal transduction histidine kinase